MKLMLFLIIALTLLPSPLAIAQDAPECDVPAIVAEYSALISEADTLEKLEEVRSGLSGAIAECQGLSFKGTNAKILGPFDIDEGIYRAVFSNESAIMSSGIIESTVVDGECDDGNLMIFMSTDGAESEFLFNSSGCSVIFELSNVMGDWTLMLEKLG
jgi:hypothetical protein